MIKNLTWLRVANTGSLLLLPALRKKQQRLIKTITVNALLLSSIVCASFLSVQSSAQPLVEKLIQPQTKQLATPFKHVPEATDAVIYQVNMRAFSATGDFQGVTNRLDNIKALGVNVIYLMPIYPVGIVKGINSPYAIRDYQGIAEEFGTLDDLRTLVAGAHQRDMAVILDFVANHTAWDHPWITEHPNWYDKDDQGKIISPHGWLDIAQLNFEEKAVTAALIKAMHYWVQAANIDGFRFDYAGGPPLSFWQQAITSLRDISSHKLLLLAEDTRSENFTAGFDFNFGFSFFETLEKVFKGESVKLLGQTQQSEYKLANDKQRVVRYTTNHDINSSHGTPEFLFGDQGAMAAFVISSYMRSTPMLYNGQEVATPEPIAFPFTQDTIDWSINPKTTQEYTSIIKLFNHNEALRYGDVAHYSSDDVLAFTRTTAKQQALVMVNVRPSEMKYKLPQNVAHTLWLDAFTGKAVKLDDEIVISAHEYVVLTSALAK